MAFVNFGDLKHAVSLEMVITHYRIPLRKVNATSLRGPCPLPTHGSKESRASFTATLTKGVGGVWACQSQSCIAARNGKKGGNALDSVATMEGCSIRDAALKLQEWFAVPSMTTGDPSTTKKQPNDPQLVSKERIEIGVEKNKPLTFTLRGVDPNHPYLQSRGVDPKTAKEFGIGYFFGRGTMSGRIVFEIRNKEGELVAYVGRAIDHTEPRYKLPSGFHKTLEVYNLHRVIGESASRKRIVVVEGFFGCLKVIAAGFACVALMGSSLSEMQEELLVSHFQVAYLLFDGDAAGRECREDCAKRLSRRMFVFAPELPEGKQPDLLSNEEIQAVIKK